VSPDLTPPVDAIALDAWDVIVADGVYPDLVSPADQRIGAGGDLDLAKVGSIGLEHIIQRSLRWFGVSRRASAGCVAATNAD
jgi:hypothetical protein